MTKEAREELEHKSLFSDERYAKKAWKQLLSKSLQSDAALPPEVVDKAGNETLESQIYKEAYSSVQKRLKDAGLSRSPMKAELIVESNLICAAFDTQTFNVILDRTAGKVKEEISIGVGQFEELSDDELALIAEHRATKKEADK